MMEQIQYQVKFRYLTTHTLLPERNCLFLLLVLYPQGNTPGLGMASEGTGGQYYEWKYPTQTPCCQSQRKIPVQQFEFNLGEIVTNKDFGFFYYENKN